jgi:antitoxin YefM
MYFCTKLRTMQVANYSEFRKNLKTHLDAVTNNHDMLVVHRQGGKSVVVMSIDDFNSMDETEYLLSTKANRKSMEAALLEYQNGAAKEHQLIELEKEEA